MSLTGKIFIVPQKPTAHGTFLLFKDEDFCFWPFKDIEICYIEIDQHFATDF